MITLGGTPPGLPSDIAAHLSSRKAEMAAAAGAIGILDISSGNAGTRPVTDWIDKEGRAGSTPQGLRVRGVIARALAERLFAASPQPYAAEIGRAHV